jgi:hypothetical protein
MWILLVGDDNADVGCVADDLEVLRVSNLKTKCGF